MQSNIMEKSYYVKYNYNYSLLCQLLRLLSLCREVDKCAGRGAWPVEGRGRKRGVAGRGAWPVEGRVVHRVLVTTLL